VTPAESLKRTKILLVAGSKETFPVPSTKTPKVGASLASIVVVTLSADDNKQVSVIGSISQIEIPTGRFTPPVSAEAVIVPPTPMFSVATEKTPVPFAPGIFTIPSVVRVAAIATISGVGVSEAENQSVLTPGLMRAGSVFVQSKVNGISLGAVGPVGVKVKTKLWAAPAGISTGVLAVPVT